MRIPIFMILFSTMFLTSALAGQTTWLASETTSEGYIARLLINEVPFPGERGWVSEKDTQLAMLAVLSVLDARLHHIPRGYTQKRIASVNTGDIREVITAGGPRGQCDGFYRNGAGAYVYESRVQERLDNLHRIAGQGKPGTFARLLSYANRLAYVYVHTQRKDPDPYLGLVKISGLPVTGRASGWMTDMNRYSPGGNFVRIPDTSKGSLGGNRFFTLKKVQ